MKKKIMWSVFTLLAAMLLFSALCTVSMAENTAAFGESNYVVAKAVASGGYALKVSWTKCEGAEKYLVYANTCSAKEKKHPVKKIAVVSKNSYTFSRLNGRKLKKNTFYKLKVIALDADGNRLAASKVIHAATAGYKGKYGNTTSVTAKISQVAVSEGNTVIVGVKDFRIYKNKRYIPHTDKIRYFSSSKSTATVNSKGVVKGISSGVCTIYMISPNGVWAKTEVLVLHNTGTAKDKAAAELTYNGETLYFENFNDAWTYANTTAIDADCVLTFLKDWIADKDSGFGDGTGYGSTGNLTPVDRKKKSVKLTIDLNGYTLNRNQTSEIKSGGVFSIKKDGVYTVKNGTVTGGNTTDRGGAFWLDNDETTINLENLTVTGNHADGNGGAVFTKASDLKLNITDCSITENSSDNYGGGMYVTGHNEYVTVAGVVVIKDNTGKNSRNNVTLKTSVGIGASGGDAYISSCAGLQNGSEIWIATSGFFLDSVLAWDAEPGMENYFKSDNPEHILVYQSNTIKTAYPPKTGTVAKENAAAELIYNGETIYFDSFNDAWTYANTTAIDADCEIKFLKDWIADKDSGFGEGTGYGSTGDLTPVDRKKDSVKLTIDLNGHTLNRNQTSEIKSGGVLSIKKDGVYTVKNGTITGGNTADRGGALWLDNDETTVNLENMTVTGNHADGNGGAVFVKDSRMSLNISDCTITGNTSDNYGGGMFASDGNESIKLSGVVVVKDNEGKNSRNNVTLQRNGIDGVFLKDCRGLEDGSKIYVAFSDFGTGTVAHNADYSLRKHFSSDNPECSLCVNIEVGYLELYD